MGVLLCLLSAACFATLGIFGELADEAGAGIATLLLVRFGLAAAIFWTGARAWPRVRALPRRTVVIGLAMGGVGYALQAVLFFAAIDRLDVSLVSLLLYTYPAFVTVASIASGRTVVSVRIVGALVIASAGMALVMLASAKGEFNVAGALFALAASLTYTTYILVADRVIGDVDPVALSTLVLTGATVSFGVVGLSLGAVDLGLGGEAWLWLVAIAVVSTVIAVSAFFAGLQRVGASEAAILSIFEPPVTVLLAFVALGETLAPVQLAGGALVLTAVVLLQLPGNVASRSARGRHHPLRGEPDPAGARGAHP